MTLVLTGGLSQRTLLRCDICDPWPEEAGPIVGAMLRNVIYNGNVGIFRLVAGLCGFVDGSLVRSSINILKRTIIKSSSTPLGHWKPAFFPS